MTNIFYDIILLFQFLENTVPFPKQRVFGIRFFKINIPSNSNFTKQISYTFGILFIMDNLLCFTRKLGERRRKLRFIANLRRKQPEVTQHYNVKELLATYQKSKRPCLIYI